MSLAKWGYLFLLRLGIFIGLLSAVVTVIYFTPIPDLHHASCLRPCHELDWPMICRFKFVYEHHQTMGGWCGDCPRNLTDCSKAGCIHADGSTGKIVAVNKLLPGPLIQVCESDIIVVEVENRVAGSSLAVHWAGQPQIGSPYMDGVPMITQCPIQPYTTFQYKFRASKHGTHFWKTHTGNELLDKVFGGLVVRRSDRAELASDLYDEDNPQHTLLISEWINPSTSTTTQPTILINGIHTHSDDLIPKLMVNRGRKYRFRVAYTHGITSCPVFISVSGHTMLVIALDGNYITPRNTSSVLIAPGERFDFILSANRPDNIYELSVESNCTQFSGVAHLVYNATSLQNQVPQDDQLKAFKLLKVLSTVIREMCSSSEGVLCLPQIESQKKMPTYLDTVDTELYLPFDLLKTPGESTPRIANISFIFPPSPLVSQPDDYYTSQLICNSKKKPATCIDTNLCECVHVIEIPLDNRVELILVDQGSGNGDGRVFHLHGNNFYVAGVTTGLENLSPDQVKERHKSGALFSQIPIKPVKKDTIAVPKGGAVSLRFKASNPGYWVLHDQSSSVWSNGMNVVFKVGKPSDLPEIPDDFPVCGNFIGPEFFLI